MSTTYALTTEQFRAAVGAAVRAPSMYNAQPWRFALIEDGIEVRIDPYRLQPVADPRRWAARLACGAAITNITLSLGVAGIATEVHHARVDTDDMLVATVTPVGRYTPTPRERALHAAIAARHSQRRPFFDVSVPVSARARMIAAAAAAGASLMLTDDRLAVARIAEIIAEADRRLGENAAYRAEMRAWVARYRLGPAGIGPDEAGVAPAGQDLLVMRDFGARERASGHDYETDPLVGVLHHSGTNRYDDVSAGMALQLVLLTAADERLATSMLSQPIEIADLRDELRRVSGEPGRPHMVLRVGFGEPHGTSPRRPIDAVID